MMKKAVKKVVTAAGLLAVTAGQSVLAALPTPVAPSTAPAAGDWIALISGYIKDGGLVLGANEEGSARAAVYDAWPKAQPYW